MERILPLCSSSSKTNTGDTVRVDPHSAGSGAQEASCSGSDRIRAQVKLNIWTQETINIISIEAATAPHCLDSGAAAAEGVLGSLLLSGNSSGHI